MGKLSYIKWFISNHDTVHKLLWWYLHKVVLIKNKEIVIISYIKSQ